MFRLSPADILNMSTALFHRLLHRKPAAPTTTRLNVCPPDVVPPRPSLWSSALRWLGGDDALGVPGGRTPLDKARDEFIDAMTGLLEADHNHLCQRARHARSLRELWHLRSELYTLIARRVSQFEADVRLARVNAHFPTRAQRTTLPIAEIADVH